MKKSVILIIIAIYFLSIIAVNFFGLQTSIFVGTTYVSSIEITNTQSEELSVNTVNDNLYLTINYKNYDEENESNPNVIQLLWHVYPDDATNKGVSFIFDDNSKVAYVNSFGTVIFKGKGILTIQIVSNDGGNVKQIVKAVAK